MISSLQSASAMLEEVYNKQYELACNMISNYVKSSAHKGLVRTHIPISNMLDEAPLVNKDELLNELHMKGYTAEINNNELIVDWSTAEPLNLFKPFSQIKPETTIGSFSL